MCIRDRDYPYATCCGLNDEVAHAFPRHVILKDGDLLKVDTVSYTHLDVYKRQTSINTASMNMPNTSTVKKR